MCSYDYDDDDDNDNNDYNNNNNNMYAGLKYVRSNRDCSLHALFVAKVNLILWKRF